VAVRSGATFFAGRSRESYIFETHILMKCATKKDRRSAKDSAIDCRRIPEFAIFEADIFFE
jgi:hypothetical protein